MTYRPPSDDERDEYRQDAEHEAEYEAQRDLWRFCAEAVGFRVCYRRGHGEGCKPDCQAGAIVERRLLDAIDAVPDLEVLIAKVEPDMMAFAESRMTPAERYQW